MVYTPAIAQLEGPVPGAPAAPRASPIPPGPSHRRNAAARRQISPQLDERRVAQLISHSISTWRAYWDLCNKFEELFFRTHRVPVPAGLSESTDLIRGAWVEEHIRQPVALLTEGRPVITRTPLSVADYEEARAERVQTGLNAVLVQLEKQSGQATFVQTVFNQCLYGAGFLHLQYAPEAWAAYDDYQQRLPLDISPIQRAALVKLKQQQKIPFILTSLDPRSVAVFRDEWGIREAVIATYRERFEVADEFPQFNPGSAPLLKNFLGPNQLGEGYPMGALGTSLIGSAFAGNYGARSRVRFYTVYNREWVAYYAESQLLDVRRHHCGGVPLFEAPGLMTSSVLPHLRYRSLVGTLLELVPSLDADMTLLHHWGKLSAFPSIIVEQDLPKEGFFEDSGQTIDTLEVKAGGYTFLAPGQKVAPFPIPPVGETLIKQIQLKTQLIHDVLPTAPILKGLPPGADTSGYSINQIRNEARTIHQPLLAGAATAYALACEMILRVTDTVVEEPIFIPGPNPQSENKRRTFLLLDPKDIDGYYTVECSITADAPMQDIALIRLGMETVHNKFFSKRYALEEFGKIQNPDQMQDEIDLESFGELPPVVQLRLQKLMERSGMTQPLNEAAQQQGVPPDALLAQAAMGGQPPPTMGGPGQPAGPGLPPPPVPPGSAPPPGPAIGPGFGPPPGIQLGAIAGAPQQPNPLPSGAFPVGA